MVKLHGFLNQFFLLLLICLAEKVRHVVSPYESDAQRAFLISKGFADFTMLDYSMHVTLFLMQTFILRKKKILM